MSITSRLAVCSWSLQPASPGELLRNLEAIGLKRIQLALDPMIHQPEIWGEFGQIAQANGIEIASGMFGTVGEDYTTLETIKRTGGVVPDEHWAGNLAHIRQAAKLAGHLNLSLVTFHAGFLPHDPLDPDFAKLANRLRELATVFADEDISVALETGQETAETLREFLTHLNRPNVGVNFDPANLILYDKGDPISALRVLAPWLKQCHVKDANRTKTPGQWGEEVVVGTGQVDWRRFFSTLAELKFDGNFCIEREAGSQRVADIKTAREFVAGLA
jgi:L-ribulose-5-phosphate 3-epimerase